MPIFEQPSPAVADAWWDSASGLVTLRLRGLVDQTHILGVERQIARMVGELADGMSYRLLVDMRNYEPFDVATHKRMRTIVPTLMLSHGMRPAYADLFPELPEPVVKSERGIRCTRFALVHHSSPKVRYLHETIGRDDQRFFTSQSDATTWLSQP